MILNIAAATLCNWRQAETIIKPLQAACLDTIFELNTESDINRLSKKIESENNFSIVLFSSLADALEHASALGVEPSQAVTLWQLNTSLVIRFCKKHRGKVLLFNLAEVLAAPHVFHTCCAQAWPHVTFPEKPMASIHHQPLSLFRVLEQHFISAIPSLLTQTQQLNALAQPLNHEVPTLSFSDLDLLVSDFNSRADAQKELQMAREKNCELQIALSQIEKSYNKSSQELKKLKIEHNTALELVSIHNNLKNENSLLLEQLFQVQESLEKKIQQLNEIEKTNTNLKKELKESKKQLESSNEKYNNQQSITRSLKNEINSLTEELKRLEYLYKETVDGKATIQDKLKEQHKKLHSLQKDKSLLLEQLHRVQEALEAQLSDSITKKRNPSGQQSKNQSLIKLHLAKRAEEKRKKRKAAELYMSPLFDARWYLAQYPDIAEHKLFSKNPALHYLKFGGFEGRNPGPDFNSQDYLDANPDVAAAGINPLYHYLRFGQAENRPLY